MGEEAHTMLASMLIAFGSSRVPRRSLTVLFFMLLVFTVSVGAYAQPAIGARGSDRGALHGGIEIGYKGVKGIALRVASANEGYAVKIIYAEVVNTTLLQTKDGKMTPEAIKETGQAVRRLFLRIQQEYHVPPEQ